MGYRINIEDKNGNNFYGTKYYGYGNFVDMNDFCYFKDIPQSLKYLLTKNKLNLDFMFGYGAENKLTLTAKQFRKWLPMYMTEAYEYMNGKYEDHPSTQKNDEWKSDENIKKLLKSDSKKIISWF